MSTSLNLERRYGFGPASGNEAGFALPAVLLLMTVLSTVSVFFLLTSSNQQRAARAMRESARSFYATEAGLNMVVAEWDSLRYDTLMTTPGDTLDLASKTLENGATYLAQLQRIDDGSDDQLFSVAVQGRTSAGANSLVGSILRWKNAVAADDFISSAVRGGAPGNSIRLRENERMSGRDTVPPIWAADCPGPLQDKPGIVWGDTAWNPWPTIPGDVRIDNPGPTTGLFGSPPLVEDPTIDATNIFQFGDMDYQDLVDLADITIADTVFAFTTDVGPVESPPGTCDTSVITNWGAPEDPFHPCYDYFPIIHVTGTLMCDAGCVGQGILLVDGEVRLHGSTSFYGLVITNRVRFRDDAKVLGGLIANGDWDSRHNSLVQYSSCAVNRALDGAVGMSAEKELVPGTWTELFQ